MSPRQRLEAIYYRAKLLILRDSSREAYLLVRQRDMNGRERIVPAFGGLDLPVDWRSVQRANQETIVIRLAIMYLWTLLMQGYFVRAVHVSAIWWLPGSFISGLLHKLWWWTGIAWPVLIVWLIGFLVMDAVVRTIRVYRSCDRTELSTEHGSAQIGAPEDFASANPSNNLFPPGYDIFGGFDARERRQRILDLEAFDAQKAQTAERILHSEAPELALGSQALVDDDRRDRPRSRVQEILDSE